MSEDWLLEKLKTIKNLAEVSIIIHNLNRHDIIYSVMELLYQEAQELLDEHCIKK